MKKRLLVIALVLILAALACTSGGDNCFYQEGKFVCLSETAGTVYAP